MQKVNAELLLDCGVSLDYVRGLVFNDGGGEQTGKGGLGDWQLWIVCKWRGLH